METVHLKLPSLLYKYNERVNSIPQVHGTLAEICGNETDEIRSIAVT